MPNIWIVKKRNKKMRFVLVISILYDNLHTKVLGRAEDFSV